MQIVEECRYVLLVSTVSQSSTEVRYHKKENQGTVLPYSNVW